MSLLISLLVMLLIFGVVYYIIGMIPLPAPFGRIAYIVLAVIFLIVLLQMLGVVGGGAGWRLG